MKLDNPTMILVLAMLLLALQVNPSSSAFEDDPDSETSPSLLRGTSRRLGAVKYPSSGTRMTCDKYPRVCHVKGSEGHDCCKKKCVNVKTDRLNCGMCGYKCRQQESCCNGRCVNVLHDKKHCGGCGSKCKKGDVCSYGMCSYA